MEKEFNIDSVVINDLKIAIEDRIKIYQNKKFLEWNKGIIISLSRASGSSIRLNQWMQTPIEEKYKIYLKSKNNGSRR